MDWGLDKILIYIFIFLIVILAIVYNASNLGDFSKKSTSGDNTNTVTDTTDTNTNTTAATYSELEAKVATAAKSYVAKYYPSISSGDNFVIQTDSLISEGYLTSIKDVKKSSTTCNGYVIVYNNGSSISYNAYLKCGSNYTTSGYDTKYTEEF